MTVRLAEVEACRHTGEEQLRAEFATIDRKFEVETAARLDQACSDGERAAGLAAFMQERLPRLVVRQEELALPSCGPGSFFGAMPERLTLRASRRVVNSDR
jgi:hypothetical protein